jgi:hypothetical protein
MRNINTFNLALAPQDIALSYTWGPVHPSHYILVDNKSFEVRDNLCNFLCAFQNLSEVRQRSHICTSIRSVFVKRTCWSDGKASAPILSRNFSFSWVGKQGMSYCSVSTRIYWRLKINLLIDLLACLPLLSSNMFDQVQT